MTMYLEHFGLKEAPFKITPHTEFFFSGANRGETLDALIYAITSGEGMVKVTGEVGAGKTMLCRVLMERLPETVETIYLAVPSLSRDEMLTVIAGDLGVDTKGGGTTRLVRALQERLIAIHGEGRQVVALIDEAHAMPLETLEEIRLLSNLETSHHKLMQIVLFGQPELDQHLLLPHMRQLKERITHSFNLLPLPARDIKDYLDFRLRAAGYKGPDLFSAEALKLIADASEGLTRRINIYADKTLLAAYAGGTHNVTADHVRAAISDTQIVLPSRKSNRQRLALAASVAAGVVIGFVAGRLTAPGPFSSPATATASTAPSAISASPTASAPTPAERISPTAAGSPSLSTPAAHTSGQAMDAPMRDWLESRMRTDRARLAALGEARYAIQLMTADQREKPAIENYLRSVGRELDASHVMVFPSGTTDNPKVSVLYGNFSERADAMAELARLPARLTQFRPYVRSIGAVRDELRPGA